MMNVRHLISMGMIASLFINTGVLAGDDHSEEDLLREVSFLAMKLLEMSGKDSYVVQSEALVKPYIGICTHIKEEGISLTCITPGSGAAKAGLKTGDLVMSIKGIDLSEKGDPKNQKKNYMLAFRDLKIGEPVKFVLRRGSETMEVDVTVGSLSHPAFKLEINR